MNNEDWFLIAVVVVAFIAGYSIVSFIIKKMKSQQHTTTPGEGQAGESQQEEAKSDSTRADSAYSDSNHSRDSQDQHERWEQAHQRRETWESQGEEQRYASVLGLRDKFTATDVKRAYRELLAKYHPDKVNHLGDEFKYIAEVKTREILEAYDYFRKKYDIK
jgi:hypothetical protein